MKRRLPIFVLLALTACAHRPVPAPRLTERHCAAGYTAHKAMYRGELIDICTLYDPVSGMTNVLRQGEVPGDGDEPEAKPAQRHWYCKILPCKSDGD